MKKLFYAVVFSVSLVLTGCSGYDDSELTKRVGSLEDRVLILEALCNKLNINVSSLHSLVTASLQNDYITEVTPLTEDGEIIGYRIEFAKSESIEIYHGVDGQDGAPGADGKDGNEMVPEIGVRKDIDGQYYWTLDGEWLLDEGGKKVQAQGDSGQDGEDGQNGITPLLKIEEGYWFISYDDGISWTRLGKATGEDGKDGLDGSGGDSVFEQITQDALYVYFKLKDGTLLTIPKKAPLTITFEDEDLVIMSTNSTRIINFEVRSSMSEVEVAVTSSADIKAKVVVDCSSSKTGSIQITTSDTIDEYSKVIVFVSDGEKVIMRTLSFEESGLQVFDDSTITVTAEGGLVELAFMTNIAYEVIIPDDVSWVSHIPDTRAIELHTATLEIAANTYIARSCNVIVRAKDDESLYVVYKINQKAGVAANQISYTTTNGAKLTINNATLKASVLSHSYADGVGTIVFDGSLTEIGKYSFSDNKYLDTMVLPDGVKSIEYCAFYSCSSLTNVSLPESLETIGDYAFYECGAMKELHVPHSVIEFGEFPFYLCGGEITLSCDLPDAILNSDGKLSATDLPLYMSSFTTLIFDEDVRYIGDFSCCYTESIQKLEIGKNVEAIGMGAFFNCTQLSEIYCYAITPPTLDNYIFDDIVTVRVPDESVMTYKNDPIWGAYKIVSLSGDVYTSSDYSSDGDVVTLQRATDGYGVDVVIMGDAYSDRQIASGFYEEDMNTAINHFFSEEPYKSFRHLFNVYMVKAVSAYEGYDSGESVFSGFFGDGTIVGGDDEKVFSYALKAINQERMDEALIVVIMNRRYYAGTCYMYYPESGDYGNGVSISYFPYETREQLRSIILHEAGGHGFSKLADEYAYEDSGRIPTSEIERNRYVEQFGWYRNIDYTSNRSKVKWSRYLNDSRYAYDGLGVFEGGDHYLTGVWRPTEDSNMRHNEGGFNAPSREAIYNRIHKLAFGESWQFDYEEFVKYDAINRKSSASMATYGPSIENFIPLNEPIVVNKSWRDVVK